MQTKLTFSQEGFPASPTAAQANASEKKTSAIFGQRCLEQYEKFPRVTSWAKMFAGSLIGTGEWYSRRCALNWKVMGIKSRPLLYLRAVSERHTEENAFGLLLKTPCAADAYTEGLSKKEQKFGNSGTLAQEVQTGFIYQRGLLPTPTACDIEGGVSDPSQISQINGRWIATRKKTGTVFGAKLRDVAGKLTTGKTSQLNPQFVAEMMGFPPNWTELPFQNGEQKV